MGSFNVWLDSAALSGRLPAALIKRWTSAMTKTIGEIGMDVCCARRMNSSLTCSVDLSKERASMCARVDGGRSNAQIFFLRDIFSLRDSDFLPLCNVMSRLNRLGHHFISSKV